MIYPELNQYIKTLTEDFGEIPMERQIPLRKIAQFIRKGLIYNKQAAVIFIFTHNSRRSHISQFWAQTAAYYYGIPDFQSYSGGTEATAFHPNAIKALQKTGFRIDVERSGENPLYQVTFSPDAPSLYIESKGFDDPGNPDQDFCAVLTCSDADKNCPHIPGASLRISLPYEDPKAYDGTSREETAYDNSIREIGREIFFLFSEIKK